MTRKPLNCKATNRHRHRCLFGSHLHILISGYFHSSTLPPYWHLMFLTHKVMMPPALQSVSTSDWPRHSICKRLFLSRCCLMETDAFLLQLLQLAFLGRVNWAEQKEREEKKKRWFSPWSEEEERGNLLIGLGPPWLSVVNIICCLVQTNALELHKHTQPQWVEKRITVQCLW